MTQRAVDRKTWAGLVALVLLGSLGLRLFGIGWGIPDYDAALMPHTPYRHSFHLDEDNFIWALMQMRPHEGNFDIVDYHWGSLQHYLIYGTLLFGTAVGVVPAPWEAAFARGDVDLLPRIFILGRLLSVVMGVACTAAVISLSVSLAGRAAGLLAGAAYAAAPMAVMEAHYLTNDVAMSTLLMGSLLASVAAVRGGKVRFLVLGGLLLGLAIACKYSAIFAAPALLAAQWGYWRMGRPLALRSSLGVVLVPWLAIVAGFLMGQPYALLKPGSLQEGLAVAARGNAIQSSGAEYVAEGIRMLEWQLSNLAAFGLTWPVALLSLAGVFVMMGLAATARHGDGPLRARRGIYALIALAAIAGIMAGLALNRVHVLRYSQPLLPLMAVAAGVGWAALPHRGLRLGTGLVAIAASVVITLGQLSLLTEPHTVNRLHAWLNTNLQPGQQVARLWPEYPVLDQRRYSLIRIDPWRPDLPQSARPDYIILDDMRFGPLTYELDQLVANEYQQAAIFRAQPSIGPFTWEEGETPHDWKYNHPTFVVYSRK